MNVVSLFRIWDERHIRSGVNSLRPRQNGRLFADDTFKRIFLNENIRISTKNSLKFVPKGLINNIPALVLIMAWRRPGDKPLSEPMLVRSLTHICVTRPQWIKWQGHMNSSRLYETLRSVFYRKILRFGICGVRAIKWNWTNSTIARVQMNKS